MFVGVITNVRSPLQAPGQLPAEYNIPEVRSTINSMLACTFTGNSASLRTKLSDFIDDTQIDELMVATYIYDNEAKLKSFSILREALESV